jgi:hypothetical protein
MTKTTPEQNKALVLKAFDTLFNRKDYFPPPPTFQVLSLWT